MPPRKPSTPITAHAHRETRPNIPTKELRDFIAEDERSPKTILYPHDPSLDPQLVWKGKDEQDQAGLAVPVVPIYIQEHIQPQAIVELLKQSTTSTDDIACWFIDTDYNGESFIVRHAYFTGADQPYEKLKRALRAEIDESAWSALYSTTSYPFEKPKSGKIAVKVINHYGDEVLKVFETE